MSDLENIRPKPVEIMLDKKRHLLYDFNAFAALEDEYGGVDEAIGAATKGSLKALRAILWAGLLHEDELLSVKDVGRLIPMAEMDSIVEAIDSALKRGLPQNSKNLQAPPRGKKKAAGGSGNG